MIEAIKKEIENKKIDLLDDYDRPYNEAIIIDDMFEILDKYKDIVEEVDNKEVTDALHMLLHCALKDKEYETQKEQFYIVNNYLKELEKYKLMWEELEEVSEKCGLTSMKKWLQDLKQKHNINNEGKYE